MEYYNYFGGIIYEPPPPQKVNVSSIVARNLAMTQDGRNT
jgi:hypothetical protein